MRVEVELYNEDYQFYNIAEFSIVDCTLEDVLLKSNVAAKIMGARYYSANVVDEVGFISLCQIVSVE